MWYNEMPCHYSVLLEVPNSPTIVLVCCALKPQSKSYEASKHLTGIAAFIRMLMEKKCVYEPRAPFTLVDTCIILKAGLHYGGEVHWS